MATGKVASKVPTPPDVWKGGVLTYDPGSDHSDLIAVYAFKHRSYTDITAKVIWILTLMNPAQSQVFIRLFGLDNQRRRTNIQIAEEVQLGKRWVTERREEIDKLLKDAGFEDVLLGKRPIPVKEASTP